MTHSSWLPLLDEFEFDLDDLYSNPRPVFPPRSLVFNAFNVDLVKVSLCILGQDPYHGQGQAHGLSFSVPQGVKIPPSLRNIFKEICAEFPERNYNFTHGDLTRWVTDEHIFLLNASLTVEMASPESHMEIWEEFTNDTISFLSKHNPSTVFLLLGNFAKSKRKYIKGSHFIVEAPHPSPLARGFIGSGVFKKVEECLGRQINWQN